MNRIRPVFKLWSADIRENEMVAQELDIRKIDEVIATTPENIVVVKFEWYYGWHKGTETERLVTSAR